MRARTALALMTEWFTIPRVEGTGSTVVDDGQLGKPVSWAKPREIPLVVCYRPHLIRTISAAVIVGTILFCVNHLDVVLAGEATTSTWVKSAITYLVPFCVANYGVVTATREREPIPSMSL